MLKLSNKSCLGLSAGSCVLLAARHKLLQLRGCASINRDIGSFNFSTVQ